MGNNFFLKNILETIKSFKFFQLHFVVFIVLFVNVSFVFLIYLLFALWFRDQAIFSVNLFPILSYIFLFLILSFIFLHSITKLSFFMAFIYLEGKLKGEKPNSTEILKMNIITNKMENWKTSFKFTLKNYLKYLVLLLIIAFFIFVVWWISSLFSNPLTQQIVFYVLLLLDLPLYFYLNYIFIFEESIILSIRKLFKKSETGFWRFYFRMFLLVIINLLFAVVFYFLSFQNLFLIPFCFALFFSITTPINIYSIIIKESELK
jgi:hypothetical protein